MRGLDTMDIGIQVLAIQGRASEDNDHHAEVWITRDVDFARHAVRVMLLREDGPLNLIGFMVEALFVADSTHGALPTPERIFTDEDILTHFVGDSCDGEYGGCHDDYVGDIS